MNHTKKLTISGTMIALGVVLSPFHIALGVAKAFPIQHLINMLAGLILGPIYSVGIAFCVSLIRNLSGTGSLFAFPGSMVGALLAGLMARRFLHFSHRVLATGVAELFGTGVLGALLCYPLAIFIMGKDAALFGMIIPFALSSVLGNIMGFILATLLLPSLSKTNLIHFRADQ